MSTALSRPPLIVLRIWLWLCCIILIWWRSEAVITMNDSSSTTEAWSERVHLTALGFCGVDDSIHPHHLASFTHAYENVEFGVLFRPDKEGTPRYASAQWVQQLKSTVKSMKKENKDMRLAAHLCGTRVHEIFEGNNEFLHQLVEWGFQRVQINATAVNGVDTAKYFSLNKDDPTAMVDSSICVEHFWNLVHQFPELEFIIQKNEETKPFWESVEKKLQRLQQQQPQSSTSTSSDVVGTIPTNIAMLIDESKGTGTLSTRPWPVPSSSSSSSSSYPWKTGFAGGIGPSNVKHVLKSIIDAILSQRDAQEQQNKELVSFWIDMESSLRSIKNDRDVFDLDKCYQVVDAVCDLKLMNRPNFLMEISN